MSAPTVFLGLPTVEPERIKVTRYRCPFCTRSRSRKQATVEHIARCWHNPAARSCKTCANYRPAYGPCAGDPQCNCGSSDEECTAGVQLPERGLITGCEKWEAIW